LVYLNNMQLRRAPPTKFINMTWSWWSVRNLPFWYSDPAGWSRCLRDWANALNVPTLCEGKEPEPAPEGAAAAFATRKICSRFRCSEVIAVTVASSEIFGRAARWVAWRREAGQMRSLSSEMRVERVVSPDGDVISRRGDCKTVRPSQIVCAVQHIF